MEPRVRSGISSWFFLLLHVSVVVSVDRELAGFLPSTSLPLISNVSIILFTDMNPAMIRRRGGDRPLCTSIHASSLRSLAYIQASVSHTHTFTHFFFKACLVSSYDTHLSSSSSVLACPLPSWIAHFFLSFSPPPPRLFQALSTLTVMLFSASVHLLLQQLCSSANHSQSLVIE